MQSRLCMLNEFQPMVSILSEAQPILSMIDLSEFQRTLSEFTQGEMLPLRQTSSK